VNKFRKFERRKTVEEKDVHLEPDEDKDVEGHVHHANLEPEAKENLRQDEGDDDDVEGHVNLNAVDLGENLGENL
jgi:hypothetical protein